MNPERLEILGDGTQGKSRAGELNKWLKMVFIPVFEFRRCFWLFCM